MIRHALSFFRFCHGMLFMLHLTTGSPLLGELDHCFLLCYAILFYAIIHYITCLEPVDWHALLYCVVQCCYVISHHRFPTLWGYAVPCYQTPLVLLFLFFTLRCCAMVCYVMLRYSTSRHRFPTLWEPVLCHAVMCHARLCMLHHTIGSPLGGEPVLCNYVLCYAMLCKLCYATLHHAICSSLSGERVLCHAVICYWPVDTGARARR